MPLAPGSRLGAFEITARIGAGGMGEVYRARDTNLGRMVALKVLPEKFATDASRLARFDHEAKVLAALNHPHIAQLYGVERADTATALVMELVEGHTLADRILEGALPVAEALPIARQIARALEAAHEQGIVHRDLKPANIKIRQDGTVKALDFGLAKSGTPWTGGSGAARGRSQSPTLITPAVPLDADQSPADRGHAMTETGTIVGTAAYMSPEQARGVDADARSDVWAFGCVLYEMLTGRRAFDADTITDTIANVLRDEPRWDRLPTDLPPVVRAFLERCLHKDRRERVHHIADVRLALDGVFDPETVTRQSAAPPRLRLVAAAILVTAVVTGAAAWFLIPRQGPRPVTRLQMGVPPDEAFYFNGRHLVAISPDGSQVAYVAGLGLWLHGLDQLDAARVPGAELEARSPFFSHDGQSIGYYAAGELRRVSVTGGAPVTVTRAVNPWGASWSDDGMIYYGQGPDGIWKVPAGGGTGERVIAVRDGEQAHGPHLLPGDEWMLFTVLPSGVGSWNRGQIVVQSLATGERVLLVDGGRDARYVPTGHLVYALNGALLAAPFDVLQRRITGGAVPVVKDVFDAGTVTGAAHFDIADNGSLAYIPRPESALLRLMWVDRNGREEAVPAEPRPYSHARVSPDGSRIAVEVNDGINTDIWVGDATRGTFTRLTLGEDVDSDPIWAPDGSRVVYSSVHGAEGLFLQPADGSADAIHLIDGTGGVRAMGWTATGRLIYEELAGDAIRLLTPDGTSKSEALRLFSAPEYFNERLPALSPDGRWLAYQSTESGAMEIYIRPFPDVSSLRRQVSVGGGFAPLWSRDGRELYYRSATSLMSVKVRTGPALEVATPQPLFSLGDYVLAGTRGIRYDVAPDGRFLLLKEAGARASQGRVVLVQNWFEELKRLVPGN